MYVLGRRLKTNRTILRQPAIRRSFGFTIVELLIVIIVIGILAALILVAYSNVTMQAKITSLKGDLTQAGKQLAIDRERGGGSSFPASLGLANNGNGITPSPGGSYGYAPNNATSPAGFCLQETLGGVTYNINGSGNTISPAVSGTCSVFTGLIGWWPLNGSAADSSSNGGDGTINGATSGPGQNGTANGAYVFTGSNMISFGPTGVLNASYTALTMSGWYKPTTAPGTEGIVMRKDNSFELGIMGNGYVRFLLGTNGGTSGWTAGNDTPYSFTNGQWYHLAATWDGTTFAWYVNGVQIKSATVTGTSVSNTNPIYINNVSPVNATIDDLRLYSRALSATDVNNLYGGGAQ